MADGTMSNMLRLVLLIVCLGLPSGAWAAIAVDTSTSVGDQVESGSSASWSHTVSGSDRALLVCVHVRSYDFQSHPTVSGITYNSVALTKVDAQSVANGGEQVRSELWYLLNPSTGANTVAVTMTGNVDVLAGSSLSLTGVKQSAQPDAFNKASGTGTAVSVSVTTVADNAWIIDCVTHHWGNTLTVGAGQTTFENQILSDPDGHIGAAASYEGPKTPAGSATMSWTAGGSSVWAIVAGSFAPATGGGGGGATKKTFGLLGVGN